MNRGTRLKRFLSGALIANSVPHVVIGLAGQQHMTPFGSESSPSVNVLWGTSNALGACPLTSRDYPRSNSSNDDRGLTPVLAGILLWSTFMFLFEMRSKRQQQAS